MSAELMLKVGTMPKNSVPLTVRISPEARKRLDEVASRIVGSEERLPLGRIIDAMVLWFFDENEWEDIVLEVREDLEREREERKARDRERKRR
jgi:hypothetical protein